MVTRMQFRFQSMVMNWVRGFNLPLIHALIVPGRAARGYTRIFETAEGIGHPSMRHPLSHQFPQIHIRVYYSVMHHSLRDHCFSANATLFKRGITLPSLGKVSRLKQKEGWKNAEQFWGYRMVLFQIWGAEPLFWHSQELQGLSGCVDIRGQSIVSLQFTICF